MRDIRIQKLTHFICTKLINTLKCSVAQQQSYFKMMCFKNLKKTDFHEH